MIREKLKIPNWLDHEVVKSTDFRHGSIKLSSEKRVGKINLHK